MTGLALSAVAAADSGDLAAASELARRAAQVASTAGLAYEEAVAGYARARTLCRAGRLADAAALADAVAQRFSAVAAPLEEALCHRLAGAAYGRSGLVGRGQAAGDRAADGFRRTGAAWLLSTMDVPGIALAALPGTSLLTARERQVAELAADGFSNQEIARRLYLSRRTIESHLTRVFSKLEVRSRTAMASRLSGR
jgi:DNA-binding NarL/FixJ family response regulator